MINFGSTFIHHQSNTVRMSNAVGRSKVRHMTTRSRIEMRNRPWWWYVTFLGSLNGWRITQAIITRTIIPEFAFQTTSNCCSPRWLVGVIYIYIWCIFIILYPFLLYCIPDWPLLPLIFFILSFDLVKRLNMYNFISNILIGNQIFNSIHCCTFWLETKLYKNVKNEFAM